MKISQRTPVFLLLSATTIALLSGCAPKTSEDATPAATSSKTGAANTQFPPASDAEYARRYNTNGGTGARY